MFTLPYSSCCKTLNLFSTRMLLRAYFIERLVFCGITFWCMPNVSVGLSMAFFKQFTLVICYLHWFEAIYLAHSTVLIHWTFPHTVFINSFRLIYYITNSNSPIYFTVLHCAVLYWYNCIAFGHPSLHW